MLRLIAGMGYFILSHRWYFIHAFRKVIKAFDVKALWKKKPYDISN